MTPSRSSAARWALSGLSVFWLGCGGGDDVPNPESDSAAAVEGQAVAPSAPIQAASPAQDPASAPIAAVPVQAAPEPVAATEAAPAAVAESAEAEPVPIATAPVSGATSEMLALSKGTAPPLAETTPAVPGAAVPAPGGGGQVTSQSQMFAQQRQQMAAGRPGGRPQPTGGQEEMQGAATQRGMGQFGATGSPGTPLKPGDFHTPMGAATAFVDAVKAKNRDSILEATAMRSSREAAPKNQHLFGSILDGSISDEELDDLAEIFQGYTVSMKLMSNKTGEASVLLSKSERGTQLTRKVELRKEKAGWKVNDFSGYRDMSSSGTGIRKKPK